MSRSFKSIGGVMVLALALASCSLGAGPGAGGSSTTSGRDPRPLPAPSLVAFDACESFLDYVIAHAVDRVGPYGLEDQFNGWWGGPMFFGEDVAAERAATDPTSGGQEFSGTNVQVLGVDEPDMVKTDGSRIVVLSEGTLVVADVTGDEPVVTGRLQLGNRNVQSLFLAGDKVLIFGSAWNVYQPLVRTDTEFAPTYQSPTMELVEVDVSGEPRIVRTMTVDGQFISARMVGDVVRLVSTSGPVGFEWSYPSGTGLRAEQRAIEENKEIVRRSKPDNWIPYYIVTDASGKVTRQGNLFECGRASHPEEFSGFNMLSVVTIDLSRGLLVTDSTGVLANGDTVYASEDALYVATQNWAAWQWAREGQPDEQPSSVTTDIHKFDTSDPNVTRYVATGEVEGYLLSQFAMDEFEGNLRVASTTSPSWWGSGFESESLITVLSDSGAGTLAEIGRMDGLGKTEQIYSVRFMGESAYVVTFRQTDPLYTIDLSNPRKPKVVGELKILGYSAYLHPVGQGLVVGIGQDATEEGRIQGTQISLFDVSDPSNPRRIDQLTLSEGTNSQVEYDHHAFLYWEPTGLIMIPVQQYWWEEDKEDVFFGAIGLTVDKTGLTEVRRFSHPGGDSNQWDYRAQILRSIVVGDRVFTVSAKGIMTMSLDLLEEIDFLGF